MHCEITELGQWQ